jgi:hypothetical protein
VAAKVIAWKEKFSHYEDNQPLLGKGWYGNYMMKNQYVLWKGRAKSRDSNPKEWVTYKNCSNKYNCAFETMVKAGVAEKLPEAVWFDHE